MNYLLTINKYLLVFSYYPLELFCPLLFSLVLITQTHWKVAESRQDFKLPMLVMRCENLCFSLIIHDLCLNLLVANIPLVVMKCGYLGLIFNNP